MFEWSGLISIAIYVLQALGFYTIAKRRGIDHAWLAWVPVGSAWILGSICDDFKTRRTGKKHGFRIAILILNVVAVVLSVAMMISVFSTLGHALTSSELLDYAAMFTLEGNDLYAPSEEEMAQQMAEMLDERLTEEVLDQMLSGVLAMVVISLLLSGAAIAMAVIECICMYNLFESCDPANKLVFFLIGLFVGIWGVFVFVVRNKDLGMPRAEFDSQLPPAQEPWQQ